MSPFTLSPDNLSPDEQTAATLEGLMDSLTDSQKPLARFYILLALLNNKEKEKPKEQHDLIIRRALSLLQAEIIIDFIEHTAHAVSDKVVKPNELGDFLYIQAVHGMKNKVRFLEELHNLLNPSESPTP